MTEPNWNHWFSRIRLGLWTDTDHYSRMTRGLPVGLPKSSDYAWMPFHGYHHFIAGMTGYGKSNTERVVLKELKPGIRDNAVEVIGIDAQRGVELEPVWKSGYLKEFYWGKDSGQTSKEWPHGKPYEVTFAEALERHVGIMYERTDEMRKMGINEWHITPDAPARVILIDEAGQLFRRNVPTGIKNRVIGAIDTIAYQSRKCGYVLVVCTQHANVDAIPIRHGLTHGVAHRMGSQLGYEQVTKNGRDMPPLAKGVRGLAYMSGYGKRVLRTQRVDVLERLHEPAPVEVMSERLPVDVPNPYEAYVNTVTGEVLEDLDFREEYEYR